jgi:hypothetical protein
VAAAIPWILPEACILKFELIFCQKFKSILGINLSDILILPHFVNSSAPYF